MKLSVVALLLGAFVACHANVRAADARPVPQSGPKAVPAKIIVVDRTAKALTVDVNGTIHLYWLGPNAKFKKDGKDVTIAELVPGQTVRLVMDLLVKGGVREVVVEVVIEPNGEPAEEAGIRGRGNRNRRDNGRDNGRDNKRDDNGRGNGNNNGTANPVPRGQGTPPIFVAPPVNRPPVSPHN